MSTSTIPSDLPAREVDRRLRAAVAELRRAEQNAVLWFGEVLHRKLYRDLGFGSIQQYADVALGFGPAKTAQFIRLAGALRELPRLRESVARGDLTWTQARTVAGVATPRTEAAWLAAAQGTSSRGLERRVRVARVRARLAGAAERQEALSLKGPDARPPHDRRNSGTGSERVDIPPVPPVESLPLPRDVRLRFSPEQGARYEALLEAARKQGVRGDQAELLLAGLEALVIGTAEREPAPGTASGIADGGAAGADGSGTNGRRSRSFASPYQVLVQLCPSCAGGSVVSGRGAEPLHPQELRAILCDARVRQPGGRNRAVIPARVRREILERDGHRCRSAGCGSARFLAVHHRTPREAGGTNDPENLVTLCSSCHRALHGHAGKPRGPTDVPGAAGAAASSRRSRAEPPRSARRVPRRNGSP